MKQNRWLPLILAVTLIIGFGAGLAYHAYLQPSPALAQYGGGPASLQFEEIKGKDFLFRARVPGGWLVLYTSPGEGGMAFVPDPRNEWR